VLRDVREGYVSVERAREDYGVALTADTSAVDVDATKELRRRLRAARTGGAS
jgi:N-methylhydantoinase B